MPLLTAQKEKGFQPHAHSTARNQPGTSYRETDRYGNHGNNHQATHDLYDINFDKAEKAEMLDNNGKVEPGSNDRDARNDEAVYTVVDKSRSSGRTGGSYVLEFMQEESAKALSDIAFYYGGAQNVESQHQEHIVAAAAADDDIDNDVSDDNDEKIEEMKENYPSEHDEQSAGKLKVRFVE